MYNTWPSIAFFPGRLPQPGPVLDAGQHEAPPPEGSRTDDEVVAKEEEAIKLDGLSVAEIKNLRDIAEKHAFQAEVSVLDNFF